MAKGNITKLIMTSDTYLLSYHQVAARIAKLVLVGAFGTLILEEEETVGVGNDTI